MAAFPAPERSFEEQAPESTEPASIWRHVRPAPRTLAEANLPLALLEELTLKLVRHRDSPTLADVARTLCLHTRLCELVLDGLVRRKLATIESADSPLRAHFRFRLSDDGKAAADEAIRRCTYSGAAPIPIDEYTRVVKSQAGARLRPNPEQVDDALAHLVLPRTTIDGVGQAYASGRALMVYGPSGNGKTDIVVSVATCLGGTALMPHALYAQGHIIEVFDAQLHVAVVNPEMEGADVDRRWREIRRPVAIAGGEMSGSALELSYDPVRNVHVAPLSVRAQSGVLVIDDLGRQRSSLQSILNRWIQLMESGSDTFALQSSEIITLPFDVTLVFATNLTLGDLVDEAYLRRISYKISVNNPTPDELRLVLDRVTAAAHLRVEAGAIDYAISRLYSIPNLEPKSCYPRDLIQTMTDGARYRRTEPVFDQQTFDWALKLYLGERAESVA